MAKPSALFRAAVLLACLGLAAAAAGAEPGGLKAIWTSSRRARPT